MGGLKPDLGSPVPGHQQLRSGCVIPASALEHGGAEQSQGLKRG